MKHRKLMLLMISCLPLCSLLGLEVFTLNSAVDVFGLEQLRKLRQESFSTRRFKHESDLIENWKGIPLQAWLTQQGYDDFQSIRFESEDNYMVRIHRAELDSMPGYIALRKDGKLLEESEIRLIFPAQRDMFWVRGLTKIFLEDFQPAPPPQRIYLWEKESGRLTLAAELEPFIRTSGYLVDEVMRKIFYQDSGSVILVSRDGIKMRLEYPNHLDGSVLELTAAGNLNLKSPVIPAGMWLKDIVYLQCGPYALIRYDCLYRLPWLAELLDWFDEPTLANVYKVQSTRQIVPLESLYAPGTNEIGSGEWIELP